MTDQAPPAPATSVADLLCARAGDRHCGLVSGDDRWTWDAIVDECAARAALLRSSLPAGPPHVGVLLPNVPEYVFWLGAAALAGAVVVGVNPTRRGEALAADIRRTDCALLVTDADGAGLLEGLSTGVPDERVLRVDSGAYRRLVAAHTGVSAGAVARAASPGPSDLFLLLFTSGTTGDPKAVRCTQGRLASIAARSAEAYGTSRDDVAYCALPLFHGNALMVLLGPALVVGATIALAPRFSASGFVADVRRYGVTTFTYVGKALAYVLATPPSPEDASVTLRRGFGTEASVADRAAFEERFGCVLTEGYGSSEGGVAIVRTPDTPPGALGRPVEDVVVLDPATSEECPPARFDGSGMLDEPRRGDRRDREPLGHRRLRGLLRGRGGGRRPDPQRVVLDGRSRLPRRRRQLLLRGARWRLAAGRLGEPDRRDRSSGSSSGWRASRPPPSTRSPIRAPATR